MKIRANLHTHTTWCDGANTPREMVEAAIAAGLHTLGFSGHSPAPFDETCLGVRSEAAYAAEIRALAAEYAGRIDILCGIEHDYYTKIDRSLYDYIIGSVHYMPVRDGRYNAADADAASVLYAKNELYGGDGLAMAADFYGLTLRNLRENRPDIIGHFDVLAKMNREAKLFDEESPAYRDIALGALDEALREAESYGGIFEVNTGAMSRGLRDVPYPAPFMLEYMAQRGARVMPSSDSHAAGTVAYALDETAALLRECGFTSLVTVEKGRFTDTKITG